VNARRPGGGGGTGSGHGTSARRVIVASLIGTSLEWYDFFIYGTAAALVFNELFFPSFEPLVGTLLAFTTYAVGFVARPLGGIVFGHYGDKIGRKNVLVVTLLIMGFATFAIGLLPTYTTIGLWAAVLLAALRFLQGLGLGGEWGGAVLMSLEHGDTAKRGLNASWPQVGVPAGLLLANGVMAVMSAIVRPAGGVHLRAVQHQAALQRCLTRVPDRGRAGRSAGPDHLHRFAGPVRHVGRGLRVRRRDAAHHHRRRGRRAGDLQDRPARRKA
jgi:Sugar (and other) transporter